MAEKEGRIYNFMQAREDKLIKSSPFGPIASGMIKPKPDKDGKKK